MGCGYLHVTLHQLQYHQYREGREKKNREPVSQARPASQPASEPASSKKKKNRAQPDSRSLPPCVPPPDPPGRLAAFPTTNSPAQPQPSPAHATKHTKVFVIFVKKGIYEKRMPPGRPPKRPSDGVNSSLDNSSGSSSKTKLPRVERGPEDFSKAVQSKLQTYTRTGQACDRCKVRTNYFYSCSFLFFLYASTTLLLLLSSLFRPYYTASPWDWGRGAVHDMSHRPFGNERSRPNSTSHGSECSVPSLLECIVILFGARGTREKYNEE